MMMSSGKNFKIDIDDRQVRRAMRVVQKTLGNDVNHSFREFARYMAKRTDATFRRLRRGGSFRGVTWADFSPDYMGKLRPSGKRVTSSSSLLQDTGLLKAQSQLVRSLSNKHVIMGTKGVSYAGHQQKSRPFLFFQVPKDTREFGKIILNRLDRALRRN